MKSDLRLSQNLERLLNERNETLSSVSRRLSINRSTLYNYLQGVAPKNLSSLQSLAAYFGISLTELLFGDVTRPPGSKKSPSSQAPIEGEQYEIVFVLKRIRKVKDSE